jgi:hypothetical protein
MVFRTSDVVIFDDSAGFYRLYDSDINRAGNEDSAYLNGYHLSRHMQPSASSTDFFGYAVALGPGHVICGQQSGNAKHSSNGTTTGTNIVPGIFTGEAVNVYSMNTIYGADSFHWHNHPTNLANASNLPLTELRGQVFSSLDDSSTNYGTDVDDFGGAAVAMANGRFVAGNRITTDGSANDRVLELFELDGLSLVTSRTAAQLGDSGGTSRLNYLGAYHGSLQMRNGRIVAGSNNGGLSSTYDNGGAVVIMDYDMNLINHFHGDRSIADIRRVGLERPLGSQDAWPSMAFGDNDRFGENVSVGCGRIVISSTGITGGDYHITIWDLDGMWIGGIGLSELGYSETGTPYVSAHVACGRIVMKVFEDLWILSLDGWPIKKISDVVVSASTSIVDYAVGGGKIYIISDEQNSQLGRQHRNIDIYDMNGEYIRSLPWQEVPFTSGGASSHTIYTLDSTSVGGFHPTMAYAFGNTLISTYSNAPTYGQTNSGAAWKYRFITDQDVIWENALENIY